MLHSSTNSAAMQQRGLPNGVGAILLAAVAVVPVACELEGIVKTLSFLGSRRRLSAYCGRLLGRYGIARHRGRSGRN